jgi:hypothetical protein
MSAPLPPSGDLDGADRHHDPMDELEFSAHDMMLFARVVACFANGLLDEIKGPLTWKVEALAMLCNKATRMAQKLCQTAEEARKHAA